MIHVTVTIDVIERRLIDFLALVASHAARSRTERGCWRFDVEVAGPCRFTLHESYVDRAALEAHRRTQHYAEWRALIDMMEERSRTHTEHEERIVVAPGCFDVLHAGHVHLLTEARAAGDRLIVLLNSDASVRRLKGEGRPIVPEAERYAMLRALRCVDEVRVFDDADPGELVRELQPALIVKGAEQGRPIPEAADCEVLIIPRLPGISTTAALERMRQ